MIRFLVVLIAAFVLVGCRGKGHWETEEKVQGFRGKSRTNPYLAAERLLLSAGFDASSGRVWSKEFDDVQTVFLPSSFLTTKVLGQDILDWVSGGGLLVVFAEGGEAHINDHRRGSGLFSWNDSEDGIPGYELLLEEIGVKEITGAFSKVELPEESEESVSWHVANISYQIGTEEFDYQVEFEGKKAFELLEYGLNYDGGKNDARMVTTPHGRGQVMLLSHARAFRNAFIDHADHAAFIEDVAKWNGSGEVLFLFGSGASFSSLLWQHFWQAVVGFLALLVVWLWMRMPRFGPIKSDPALISMSYGVHLTAAARFLWRRRRVDHLLKPLQEEVAQEEEFFEQLAEEHDLKVEEIKDAVNASQIQDPGAFVRITRILQILTRKS